MNNTIKIGGSFFLVAVLAFFVTAAMDVTNNGDGTSSLIVTMSNDNFVNFREDISYLFGYQANLTNETTGEAYANPETEQSFSLRIVKDVCFNEIHRKAMIRRARDNLTITDVVE